MYLDIKNFKEMSKEEILTSLKIINSRQDDNSVNITIGDNEDEVLRFYAENATTVNINHLIKPILELDFVEKVTYKDEDIKPKGHKLKTEFSSYEDDAFSIIFNEKNSVLREIYKLILIKTMVDTNPAFNFYLEDSIEQNNLIKTFFYSNIIDKDVFKEDVLKEDVLLDSNLLDIFNEIKDSKFDLENNLLYNPIGTKYLYKTNDFEANIRYNTFILKD